jgi:23S rRNA pseudouridine1911/1915/1917 synthase
MRLVYTEARRLRIDRFILYTGVFRRHFWYNRGGMKDALDPQVVWEDPSLLIVDKPAGVPTVPLKEHNNTTTLLSLVAKRYPEVIDATNKNPWEGGVIHRLDTPTSGLVLIARTAEAHQRLYAIGQMGLFIKEYLAISSAQNPQAQSGFPPFPYEDPVHCGGREVAIGSLFRRYGDHRREVRPVLADSARHLLEKTSGTWYLTRVVYTGESDDAEHRFVCRLANGFRHQVRAHLAWSGWPLDGDLTYGGVASPSLGLRAVAVEFPHPITSKLIEVRID